MRDIITPSELEKFGFAGATLAPVERIEIPPGDAEAAGVREMVLVGGLLALPGLAGSAHFDEIDHPLLQKYGISVSLLDADQRIVRARTTEPVDIKEGGEEKKKFIQFEQDPGAVYWDTSQAARLVGSTENKLFVIMRDEQTGDFIVQVAVGYVHHLPPLERVDAPLAQWAETTNDRWLAERLREHAAIGGSWPSAAGAGLYARLYVPPDREAAAARIARFTQGREDTQFATPRQWARLLAAGQMQTIEDLALAEVDALFVALEDLEGDVEENTGDWVDEWRSISHRRDDLEGIKIVLQESGRDARLRSALDRLDRAGRRLLINVPHGLLAGDERLRRARLLDPSAWWTDPALDDVL